MVVGEQDPLERALAAWRADIDSVRIPELLSVPTAVALVMAAWEARRCGLRPRDQHS